MCRMLGARSEGGDEAGELAGCLVEAARRDHRYGNAQHRDGWGAAVVMRGRVYVLRSGRAIYEEGPDAISLPRGTGFLAILHARMASEASKVGPQYSHPYEALAEEGKALYIVAHNGFVDVASIARRLGVSPEAFVDSELVAMFLGRAGLDEDALLTLHEATRTALDLLIIRIDRIADEATLYGYSYWKRDDDLYYALYWVRWGSTLALASSTVADLCARRGWNVDGPVGEGRLVEVGRIPLR